MNTFISASFKRTFPSLAVRLNKAQDSGLLVDIDINQSPKILYKVYLRFLSLRGEILLGQLARVEKYGTKKCMIEKKSYFFIAIMGLFDNIS